MGHCVAPLKFNEHLFFRYEIIFKKALRTVPYTDITYVLLLLNWWNLIQRWTVEEVLIFLAALITKFPLVRPDVKTRCYWTSSIRRNISLQCIYLLVGYGTYRHRNVATIKQNIIWQLFFLFFNHIRCTIISLKWKVQYWYCISTVS